MEYAVILEISGRKQDCALLKWPLSDNPVSRHSTRVSTRQRIVFWDLAAGVIKRTVRAPHAVTALAFAPDGNWVAMTVVGGKEISLFGLAAATP